MVLGCSVNRNRADLQRHPGKPSQAMADTIDGMSDGIDGMGGCHRWHGVLPSMAWVVAIDAMECAIDGMG